VASKTIEAAGGIVVRKGAGGLIAVVQRSKDDAWVLPRGKLKRDEDPVAGARREVVEETGHRVEVHEYLGAITYRAGGRPKVVQFWRMEADAEATHELMPDIVAVDWLPLKAAVRRLSYPLEKLFLRHAIARALKKRRAKAKQSTARKPTGARKAKSVKTKADKAKPKTAKLPKKIALKTKAAKPSSKLHPAAKSAKAGKKANKKTKKKAKDRAKDKHRAGRKVDKKAEKKADKKAARKAGRPEKDKARKAGKDHSRHAVAPVNPAPAEARPGQSALGSAAESEPKAHLVSALSHRGATPPRAGAQTRAAEHKTILQRVLGRLGG